MSPTYKEIQRERKIQRDKKKNISGVKISALMQAINFFRLTC